jgi:hypothetical protein
MRTFLLTTLMLVSVVAADAPMPTKPAPATPKPTTPATAKPTEAAPTVDAATAKKAEDAADAYLKQANTRPDPLAETALAEIEVLLLEVHAFIDAKQPLKGGERYLSAIEKRKTITDEQRPLLGKRLRKADTELLALSRELLGQPAFDLGDPPTEQPADGQSPADKPIEQPAK